jgi:hypothetical protein
MQTSAITLAFALFANALICDANADERPSGLQTELTDTTISGDVDASADIGTVAPPDLSATFSISAVPEPSSIRLLSVGAAGVIIFSIAKRRRQSAIATGK